MKIINENPEFTPITITLESQWEASILAALLKNVCGSCDARDFYSDLAAVLDKGLAQTPYMFSDAVTINENHPNANNPDPMWNRK